MVGQKTVSTLPERDTTGRNMAVSTPPQGCKRVRVRKGLKKYTYLGCPMTRNRSPWCFRMCKPSADGTGRCGRVAPHGFKGYIQQGIADFKRRQAGLPLGLPGRQAPAFGKDL